MGSRLTHIEMGPIYGSGHPSVIHRFMQAVGSLVSRAQDLVSPERVCRRSGQHLPGQDVFEYEGWDLDHRYPGAYLGHACGRCGRVT
jgi:hypothetical protein